MRPVTFYLPDDLRTAAQQAARKRGETISEFMRSAIAQRVRRLGGSADVSSDDARRAAGTKGAE